MAAVLHLQNTRTLAAYVAVALDLEIDRDSGRIRLGRAVAADDSGQAVNPDGIKNQVEGAIVQAASWTLARGSRVRPHADHEPRLGHLSDPAF